MDTGSLYATFTHPKVVTSMLLVGIGLGLLLSVLMVLLAGQWYLPVAFVLLAFLTLGLYMAWLDRQDLGDELEQRPRDMPGVAGNIPVSGVTVPAAVRPAAEPPVRSAILLAPKAIASILLLGIGLGLVLCVLIILFIGTWYLPALFAICAVGMVAGYLYWLDGQSFPKEG